MSDTARLGTGSTQRSAVPQLHVSLEGPVGRKARDAKSGSVTAKPVRSPLHALRLQARLAFCAPDIYVPYTLTFPAVIAMHRGL